MLRLYLLELAFDAIPYDLHFANQDQVGNTVQAAGKGALCWWLGLDYSDVLLCQPARSCRRTIREYLVRKHNICVMQLC